MGLALAIKDAVRSGDLYLPQSKQHVSFWDLTRSATRWQEMKTAAFDELHQPHNPEAKAGLTHQFREASALAKQRFAFDDFAAIEDGTLQLKRYYKTAVPPLVPTLQKGINDVSIGMLRHVLHAFVREETLTAASAEIVNLNKGEYRHTLPCRIFFADLGVAWRRRRAGIRARCQNRFP